jgi:hypothetical protein
MKSLSEIVKTSNEANALQKQQTSLPSTQEQIKELRDRFPNFQSFCAKFNPQNSATGAQHPTKCITCSSPTLTYLNLAYGDGNAIAWLIWHLTFFQENINVPHKMSTMQLETCAQTIYDHYHHLKTTEVMLFLARLLGGMYPIDWCGYITPTKIMTALREHFMPWRNDLLYKLDKQEKDRKAKEDAAKPTCTWEEFLAERGEDYRDSPLERLING